ncbi:SRPBCC domain-containing protein [Thermoflexibacter ruber]|uniref:Activator of Hsp90 ATPase homolog 1-like protein n=1 Tax=Thermoflexibacter ruber TaxID=1003 RepID=A0A1I2HF97_9BACT|nr:SRPBCC domain-containing protein [Thermoflexibacter ruber]SFF27181.1 Activator of Hsp90 ATPase homolog 1-like protein [Thermoflexibacter ruber]
MNNPITVTATINADSNKVWEYYTNPKHIVNWNFADPTWHCPKAQNELRKGGQYFARMEAKDGSFGFDFIAIYTEVIVWQSFTYEFGGRKATVQINKMDNQTEITVTFEPESEHPIDIQKAGWQAILNNFKNYTETN